MENNTLIVSFSARKNGNCEQIAEYIHTLLEKRTNVSVLKFSDFQIKLAAIVIMSVLIRNLHVRT